MSGRLKTKCDHCQKPLTPDKWEQCDWPVHCSQECEIAAKAIQEYFQKRFFK